VDLDGEETTVARAARRVAEWDENPPSPALSGFYQAVWDGDLAEALYRADAKNKRLLLRLLPEQRCVVALYEDRSTLEGARNWYDDHNRLYGWPAVE